MSSIGWDKAAFMSCGGSQIFRFGSLNVALVCLHKSTYDFFPED